MRLDTRPPARTTGWPRRPWVTACVIGEAVGMTAAAAAARAADLMHQRGAGATAALAVVVCGGLVEGGALGALQGRALSAALGAAVARRWALVTLVVAGLGWGAASAPAVLSTADPAAAEPPLALVLAAAAGLGLAMGAVLGVAQAAVLRHRVPSPWHWVWISAVGWCPAMVVIFLGATLPTASTPTAVVVPLGTVTGLAAGAVLGLLTSRLAARLAARRDGRPASL